MDGSHFTGTPLKGSESPIRSSTGPMNRQVPWSRNIACCISRYVRNTAILVSDALYLIDQQESMHIKLLAPQHYNCIWHSQMSQLESAEEKIEWP